MFRTLATTTAFAFALGGAAFAQDPDLSAVSQAVDAANSAGLAEQITSAEGLTVFVPTNDALSAVPTDALSAVTGDQEQLTKVITYYAVPGKLMAADVVSQAEANDGMLEVETLNGAMLKIMVEGGNVMIEGQTGATATVTTPDIEVGNVVLHVIDGAVLPEAPGGDSMSSSDSSDSSMSDSSDSSMSDSSDSSMSDSSSDSSTDSTTTN